jgi:hypothetical protein
MSAPETPPAAPVPRQRFSRAGAILLTLLGIVMLLPGLCSLFFIVVMPGLGAGAISLLWLLCFAISAGGIWLITYAVGNR